MYVPLAIPPGIVRTGTQYDSRGRWYDSNLIRWRDGATQPIGGWTVAYASTGSGTRITDPIRGMMAYQVDIATNKRRLALGTYQNAYQYLQDGTMWNITPSGLTAGSENASVSSGGLTEASCWIFDVIDSDLVGMLSNSRYVYEKEYTSGSGVLMTVLSGAPEYNQALVVTPENFLMVLGADARPRRVQWCDQGDRTTWTATASNQAGDYDLPTNGWIQAGRRGREETLIWTDVDLWAARYTGGQFVYRFDRLGSECGALSRRSMAVVDGKAIWMGNNSFYIYDGYVRPIPCEVGDYVFGRLNRTQRSKVAAWANTDFHEVTWFYPSGSGTPECDSYVTYNYLHNWWSIGFWDRTDGVDRQFNETPYLGSPSGALYAHETGTTYAEEDASTLTPYVESGPVELGNGDTVMMVRQYIPDEDTLGEVNTTLLSRFYPTASETTNGPYTNENPTDIRVTCRQVRIKHTQVTGGFRVGTPRLEVVPGGLR